MRIVSFHDFCEMPTGTVFQEYAPHFLGDVMVRGDVRKRNDGIPVDFLQAPLTPSCVTGNHWGREPIRLKDGEITEPHKLYISAQDGFKRWGVCNARATFLVWDMADRVRMAEGLINPHKAVDRGNGCPDDIIEAGEAEGRNGR